ncbi:hypothetical protein [Thiolapillus sp.]
MFIDAWYFSSNNSFGSAAGTASGYNSRSNSNQFRVMHIVHISVWVFSKRLENVVLTGGHEHTRTTSKATVLAKENPVQMDH